MAFLETWVGIKLVIRKLNLYDVMTKNILYTCRDLISQSWLFWEFFMVLCDGNLRGFFFSFDLVARDFPTAFRWFVD